MLHVSDFLLDRAIGDRFRTLTSVEELVYAVESPSSSVEDLYTNDLTVQSEAVRRPETPVHSRTKKAPAPKPKPNVTVVHHTPLESISLTSARRTAGDADKATEKPVVPNSFVFKPILAKSTTVSLLSDTLAARASVNDRRGNVRRGVPGTGPGGRGRGVSQRVHAPGIDGVGRSDSMAARASTAKRGGNPDSAQSAASPRSTGRGGASDSQKLLVLIPELGSSHVMKVLVPPSATVTDTILIILSQRKAEGGTPLKGSGPASYLLRIVDEEDMEIDDDFPPLDHSKRIQSYALQAVALCFTSTPSAAATAAAAAAAASLSTGESMDSVHHLNPLAHPFADGKRPSINLGGGRARTVSYKLNESASSKRFFVRVLMIDGESHVVKVSDDTRLRDLLEKVSKKKKMDKPYEIQKYEFLYECTPSTTALDMDMKTEDLLRDAVFLKRKDVFTEGHRSDVSQYSWTRESVSQYKEYKVIKINRRGRAQDRLLGVDLQRLQNKVPPEQQRKGTFAGVSLLAVKRKERLMRDIIDVGKPAELDDISSRQFYVTFRDGSKTIHVDYEASTPDERQEIVSRLRYVVELYKQGRA